jgi:hypothetical protein
MKKFASADPCGPVVLVRFGTLALRSLICLMPCASSAPAVSAVTAMGVS